jgi:hypothetical protein
MAGGFGRRRRTVLLFTVLAGLFLMHGLSAPSMHAMPMRASAPKTAPMTVPMTVPPRTNTPIADGRSDPMPDLMQASMTCVPLRPDGTTGLFLALFLIVTTLWRPMRSLPARLIHPRWPHGPPRTGVQTLRALSISRT